MLSWSICFRAAVTKMAEFSNFESWEFDSRKESYAALVRFICHKTNAFNLKNYIKYFRSFVLYRLRGHIRYFPLVEKSMLWLLFFAYSIVSLNIGGWRLTSDSAFSDVETLVKQVEVKFFEYCKHNGCIWFFPFMDFHW